MANILIFGASGNVGSELSKLLAAAGHKIRSTTSKTPKTASEMRVNLTTGEGIRQAFEGVDRAFLLSPSGNADQHRILSPLIQEAKRRGVDKVVLMSAMGANADEKSPLRQAEIELENSGLNYNIIRPNWFMQNFHTFWIGGIKAEGKIFLPAKKAKVSFIDTRDISAVAAKLLTSDEFNNQAFDITGPEAIDHDQVAQLLTKVSGKKISYQEIDSASFRSGLLGAGLPADYAEFLVLIAGFLAEGYSAPVTHEVEKILGRKPNTFANYARDFSQAWK